MNDKHKFLLHMISGLILSGILYQYCYSPLFKYFIKSPIYCEMIGYPNSQHWLTTSFGWMMCLITSLLFISFVLDFAKSKPFCVVKNKILKINTIHNRVE